MPDPSQNNRLEKREALDLALFHKLTSGDPESFVSQAPALLQSHGGGLGLTSDGRQLVVSSGDLPDPWISTDHKHAVISLR